MSNVGAGLLRPALAALAVACAALTGCGGGAPQRGGPVAEANADGFSVPMRITPSGATGATGVAEVFNTGKEDAVLEKATPMRVTPGFEVLRVAAGTPERVTGWFGSVAGWPPTALYRRESVDPDDLRPVPGFVLRPDAKVPRPRLPGTNIVIIFRAAKPGRYAFHGLELIYRVGDTRYRRVVRTAFGVCARMSLKEFRPCNMNIRAPSEAQAAAW